MTLDELKRLIAEATPGPWQTVGWMPCGIYSSGDMGDAKRIAQMDRRHDHDANARLIAAAPDLAAQVVKLTEALEFYANPEIYKPHPHGPGFDRSDLSYVARAAIGDLK